MAFCTKCGTQLETGAAFCGDCGAAIAVTPSIQPSFSENAPQARSAEDITTAEMKFIGKNHDYFNRKWKIGKQSWNWAAFFLAVPWLAYRKMYLNCWILIGAVCVLTICDSVFNLSNAIYTALNIGIASTFGWQGNFFYKYHVQKKVKEITTKTSPDQVNIELTRQGGTSIGAAIGFTVAALAIVLFVGYLMGLAVERG